MSQRQDQTDTPGSGDQPQEDPDLDELTDDSPPEWPDGEEDAG